MTSITKRVESVNVVHARTHPNKGAFLQICATELRAELAELAVVLQ